MKIRAFLEYDADAQMWSATVPELNHVSSCGESEEDALRMLKEAIELMFEPLSDETAQSVDVGELALAV